MKRDKLQVEFREMRRTSKRRISYGYYIQMGFHK